MEINNNISALPSANVERILTKPSDSIPSNPIGAALSENSDSVVISKSDELKTMQAVNKLPVPIDLAKVAAIKADVAADTFKVNPGVVADGMIMSAQDFLTTLNTSAA